MQEINKTALEHGAPIAAPGQAAAQSQPSLIRQSGPDELFISVADPVVIDCVVDRYRDEWGYYYGEIYCRVSPEMRDRLEIRSSSIAFHASVSASGQRFLFPEKLHREGSRSSWSSDTLTRALHIAHGSWTTVWWDSNGRCYIVDVGTDHAGPLPEYPEFLQDLEDALSPNDIDGLDHPLIQQILDERSASKDREVGK